MICTSYKVTCNQYNSFNIIHYSRTACIAQYLIFIMNYTFYKLPAEASFYSKYLSHTLAELSYICLKVSVNRKFRWIFFITTLLYWRHYWAAGHNTWMLWRTTWQFMLLKASVASTRRTASVLVLQLIHQTFPHILEYAPSLIMRNYKVTTLTNTAFVLVYFCVLLLCTVNLR